MNRPLYRRPLRYTYYNAAFGIIIVNVLVFLFKYIDRRSVYYLSLIPGYLVEYRWYWQFVTYMFSHAGISHILFNMLGIFFFGVQVERKMGSNEFLLFYMISGVGAGIFSFIVYMLTGSYGVILLGASGAVFAVLLAYATFFPDSVIYIFGILPVRAPILVLGYTAIELFSQVFSFNTGVAHLTHLAGFGFAYLYLVIRFGVNPFRVFFGGGRRRW